MERLRTVGLSPCQFVRYRSDTWTIAISGEPARLAKWLSLVTGWTKEQLGKANKEVDIRVTGTVKDPEPIHISLSIFSERDNFDKIENKKQWTCIMASWEDAEIFYNDGGKLHNQDTFFYMATDGVRTIQENARHGKWANPENVLAYSDANGAEFDIFRDIRKRLRTIAIRKH